MIERLAQLENWQLDQSTPNTISKEFRFKSFKEALAFVNRIAEIAEEMNHHPDVILKWAYVKVTYWTHTVNGLTKLDFDAAEKIDRIHTSKDLT